MISPARRLSARSAFPSYFRSSQPLLSASFRSVARTWSANTFSAPARSPADIFAGMDASAGMDVSRCFVKNSSGVVRGPATHATAAQAIAMNSCFFMFDLSVSER